MPVSHLHILLEKCLLRSSFTFSFVLAAPMREQIRNIKKRERGGGERVRERRGGGKRQVRGRKSEMRGKEEKGQGRKKGQKAKRV